ncbi:MAG: hypothetical protein RIE56_06640 [Amphiplicatus sp.]
MTGDVVDFIPRDGSVVVPIDQRDFPAADNVYARLANGIAAGDASIADAEIISALRVSALLHYGSGLELERCGADKDRLKRIIADAVDHGMKRRWALSKFSILKSRFIAESLTQIDGSDLVNLHIASGALNAIIHDEFDRRGLVDPADPRGLQ